MADEQAQANATTGTDAGQQSAQSQAQPTQGKTFTQDELEAIISQRIARERSKYADYDELKKTKEQLEAAGKSELEKAAERAAKAEQRLKEIETQTRAREQVANAKAEAAQMGFDPKRLDKVIKLLDLDADADSDAIAKSLEALAKDMPELLTNNKRAPTTGASNPAKNQTDSQAETAEQKRARLMGSGSTLDWFGTNSGEFVYFPKADN